MKFIVSDEVFEKLEDVCFGVVVARGIDNKNKNITIEDMLDESIKEIRNRFVNVKMKEQQEIFPYREAFRKLGFNPNKFLSSIEALTSRIVKGGDFPKINNIVDLTNAISLRYIVPMGAHDLAGTQGNFQVRFSKEGDLFIPFGAVDTEEVQEGELVYTRGTHVKTRKWIWRQSEEGKITEDTKDIFFPIDGFKESNLNSVVSARDELANTLEKIFKCEVSVGFIDDNNRSMEI